MSATFTEQQKMTILAALRYWQEETELEDRAHVKPVHFSDTEPLDNEAIDDLCEFVCINIPTVDE